MTDVSKFCPLTYTGPRTQSPANRGSGGNRGRDVSILMSATLGGPSPKPPASLTHTGPRLDPGQQQPQWGQKQRPSTEPHGRAEHPSTCPHLSSDVSTVSVASAAQPVLGWGHRLRPCPVPPSSLRLVGQVWGPQDLASSGRGLMRTVGSVGDKPRHPHLTPGGAGRRKWPWVLADQ